jgi:hypothetical protein
MLMRFLRWSGHMSEGDKLVMVTSWWPSIGRHGIEWPSMLIDTRGGRRWRMAPCWPWKQSQR